MNKFKSILVAFVAALAFVACTQKADIVMYVPVDEISLFSDTDDDGVNDIYVNDDGDNAMRLVVQDSTTLSAVLTPDNSTNHKVFYKVVNAVPAGCITVDINGVMKGVAEGTAKVVVNPTGEEFTAEVNVTVVPLPNPPSEIKIPDTFSVEEGLFEDIAVESVIPEGTSNLVTWSIVENAEECITLSASGRITAIKPGEATIQATSIYDSSIVSNVCTVTVTATAYYQTITIPATASVNAFSTTTIAVESFTPEHVTTEGVTWSVTKGEEFAKIDAETGVITGLAVGEATVVATAIHNDPEGEVIVSNECVVTITAEVIVNLIKNGDFEDQANVFVDWKKGGNCNLDATANVVAGAACIRFSAAGDTQWGNTTQVVTLPATGVEATYEFGFEGRAQAAAGASGTKDAKGKVSMSIMNENGVALATSDAITVAENTKVSATVTIPETYTGTTITVKLEKLGGICYVDNAYFQKAAK